MTNIERLRKLASELYRQARAAKNPMVRRTLALRGDRFLRKAEELQDGGRTTVQASFPKNGFKAGRN
jgi:hypothetical protein